MTDQPEELLRQAAKLHREGRRPEAIELFRQVLATRPQVAEGWYELGYLLKAEGRHEEALEAYGEALARGIGRPQEVHLNRAVIYSDHLRRDQDAERELRVALAIDPDYVPALLNLGNLHEERGRLQDALVCYDRLLAGTDQPDRPYQDLRGEALARSANLRPPAGVDDPLFHRLREAAAIQPNKTMRANLLFALGRAYDRLGQFDPAFDAWAKANRCLQRQAGRTYEPARAAAWIDDMIRTFTPAGQESPAAIDGGSAEPLFICGMFRSGSTLIEQVLAAHPQVSAGGELDYLLRLAFGSLAPYPASMATPDPEREARLADGYRAHMANLFPEGIAGRYITDKRPDNFLLIGLIKRLFPTAKIIHTCRHPLDTGLSVFMHHLDLRVAGYSCDLGDIGHFYGQYRRLMAHWHSLYGDTILDFDYDDFVRAPKPALERLLAFLGLDWDDRCLEFHRLGNTVKTASYWQIRQPLSDRASGRWRNYSSHLEPLRQALQEAGVDFGGSQKNML
ncbi:tetratricopeptide repeat-containing sulfotransferase family protein [Luteimonas salinilitoris]|uniref:Sulfotransferase n=1 Tax=Luteimonas salinilitoris TaxID=3237697 RepID=A0ABV4HY12_9GAMM